MRIPLSENIKGSVSFGTSCGNGQIWVDFIPQHSPKFNPSNPVMTYKEFKDRCTYNQGTYGQFRATEEQLTREDRHFKRVIQEVKDMWFNTKL